MGVGVINGIMHSDKVDSAFSRYGKCDQIMGIVSDKLNSVRSIKENNIV